MNSAVASDAGAATALALIMGLGALAIVLALVIYVLYVIANWKIFVKAGEAGWKSIIPFYNAYIQFKFTWNTKMFWIFLALIVVGAILTNVASDNNAILLAGNVVTLAGAVIAFIDEYYLCKSFGKGTGFFVGMLILSFIGLGWIFNMILGFGSDKYIGPKGEQSSQE